MSFDQSELLDKSPLCIVISDKFYRILWCNSRFFQETLLDQKAVIGQLYPALPIQIIDKNNITITQTQDNLIENVRFTYWQQPLQTPTGAIAHYFLRQPSLKPTQSPNLSVPYRLEKRANWLDFLDYEVSRSRRYHNPLTVLKLHLLIFNNPNNIDDEVLHETVKRTLMDEMRWADMIGHTEHGAYLAVLPETPNSALAKLKEKISSALDKHIRSIDPSITYDLVFGEASWRKNDDSQSLLARSRDNLVSQLEALLASKT